VELIQCQWCQAQNQPGTISCQTCGAPLDQKDKVSDSGWREAPRLRDMTEFRFSGSSCQVEGELVPVSEINLHPQDGVYFEHHVLLWKDETVPLSSMNTGAGLKRSIAGMPHIITVASGPGRIAFSRNAPGELVVLPLHPGMELDVREHAFLVASHSIQYSFIRIKGLVNLLHGGNGMYIDRFVTAGYPGMLLLHGNGDVLERTLRPGEKIMVEPGGFLYKDSTVQMQAVQMPLKAGLLRHGMYLAEMTGPAGSASSRCTSTTTRTKADKHLHLPVLQAAERPELADLPAVRGAGRHQVRGQRVRLGRAAADQGHGPAAVRPVARPDRGHHRPGGRVQPRPG
jgi:uncharacterized protein (AIM24 family)